MKLLSAPAALAAIQLLDQLWSIEAKVDASKPQMGWNSWNSFKNDVSSRLIKETADKFIELGLKDVGYEYVVIDAGWQASERDTGGRQQANTTKFTEPIADLADYVHNLGLKLGIYSDAGILTCTFEPGSWGYEELDAQTYAEWGVDYLKYDNCGSFQASTYSPFERFTIMRNALLNSGRDIFYSLCQWGNQFPWFWADQVGQSYRMSGDIHNSFRDDGATTCKTAYCLNTGYAACSVLTIIRKMREISPFQAPGSWADMDMLEIGNGAMTEVEERTHFSFWAALKSPLIMGADLLNVSQSSVDVMKNRELIAVNQDKLGLAASYLPGLSVEDELQVWAGPLSGGRAVVLVLNEGAESVDAQIAIGSVRDSLSGHGNFSTAASSSWPKVRDVWHSTDLDVSNGTLSLTNITSHETRVLILG